MSRPSTGLAIVTVSVLVLVGSSAAMAGATSASVAPSVIGPSKWGYVVARRTAGPTYVPGPKDRGNSTGGVNSVTWTEPGHYEVTMPGLGDTGGAVIVSPLGEKPRRCEVEIWFGDGTDEVIDIVCFTRTGGLVDSPFVLTFLVASGTSDTDPPGLAYLWADQPAMNGGYLPARKYSSPVGSSAPVSRQGQGSYRVGLNALDSPGGNVQLTAVGSSPATCQTSWGPDGTQMAVFVDCRTIGMALMDEQFELTFTDRAGLKGIGGKPVTYLLADRPAAASYTAAAPTRYSSAGKPPTITRQAKGSYTVTLKGMPLGGAAVVTPIRGGPTMCSISSIRRVGFPQRIGVSCFNVNGQPKDTQFSLSFLR